jgi:hypothetical protein
VVCLILFEHGPGEKSPYSEPVGLLAERLRFDWLQKQVPPRPLFASCREDVLTKLMGASGPTGLQIRNTHPHRELGICEIVSSVWIRVASFKMAIFAFVLLVEVAWIYSSQRQSARQRGSRTFC